MEAPGRPRARRRAPARLSRAAEFDRVFRTGRSVADRLLVLHWFPRGGPPAGSEGPAGPRVGLSVSRRVGGAVERNRVKRLLREAVAACADLLPPESDVVLIARPGIADFLFERGLEGAVERCRALLERAGGGGSDRATT